MRGKLGDGRQALESAGLYFYFKVYAILFCTLNKRKHELHTCTGSLSLLLGALFQLSSISLQDAQHTVKKTSSITMISAFIHYLLLSCDSSQFKCVLDHTLAATVTQSKHFCVLSEHLSRFKNSDSVACRFKSLVLFMCRKLNVVLIVLSSRL